MTNTVKVLNKITKTLIDSQKGYETSAEAVQDNPALATTFQRRAQERSQLVSAFQTQVRALGGEPEDSGSASGALHRGFTRFSTYFGENKTMAAEAIEDGEEFLAEKIEDKLEDVDMDPQSRALMLKAHQSAKSGERLADLLGA